MTSSRFSAWAAFASKPRLKANMRCFFKMLPFRTALRDSACKDESDQK
jgi:hypothetical protein